MDGIHDLGGREGFGPVVVSRDDPPFAEEWEARVYALSESVGAEDWSIDWFRHMVELLPPQAYLSIPYFEKWCIVMLSGFVNSGVFTPEQVLVGTTGETAQGEPKRRSLQDVIETDRRRCIDYSREQSTPPRFAVGDHVRTARHGHAGHTRLPGYARDCVGKVVTAHGAHLLPDEVWKGNEVASPLYTVRFAARTLWGPDAPENDSVMIDLWEPYLEPA
jgi:nitrile hydratase